MIPEYDIRNRTTVSGGLIVILWSRTSWTKMCPKHSAISRLRADFNKFKHQRYTLVFYTDHLFSDNMYVCIIF